MPSLSNSGVWIARGTRLIFGELAGLGVELADIALEIAREANVAVSIHGQPWRAGYWGLGAVFRDLAGLGIEVADQATHVAAVPHGSRRERPADRGDGRRASAPPFLIETLTDPTALNGLAGFSGKLLTRYLMIGSTWSGVRAAPAFTIMWTALDQPSAS